MSEVCAVADAASTLAAEAQPGPSNALQFDATDYQCPICLDLLLDPVVGSCGHDFCKHCLQLWRRQRRTEVPWKANLECPVCRTAWAGVNHCAKLGVCVRLRNTIDQLFPNEVAARRAAHHPCPASPLPDSPIHETEYAPTGYHPTETSPHHWRTLPRWYDPHDTHADHDMGAFAPNYRIHPSPPSEYAPTSPRYAYLHSGSPVRYTPSSPPWGNPALEHSPIHSPMYSPGQAPARYHPGSPPYVSLSDDGEAEYCSEYDDSDSAEYDTDDDNLHSFSPDSHGSPGRYAASSPSLSLARRSGTPPYRHTGRSPAQRTQAHTLDRGRARQQSPRRRSASPDTDRHRHASRRSYRSRSPVGHRRRYRSAEHQLHSPDDRRRRQRWASPDNRRRHRSHSSDSHGRRRSRTPDHTRRSRSRSADMDRRHRSPDNRRRQASRTPDAPQWRHASQSRSHPVRPRHHSQARRAGTQRDDRRHRRQGSPAPHDRSRSRDQHRQRQR